MKKTLSLLPFSLCLSLSLSLLTARLKQARHDHRIGSPVQLMREVLAIQKHDPRAFAPRTKLVALVQPLDLFEFFFSFFLVFSFFRDLGSFFFPTFPLLLVSRSKKREEKRYLPAPHLEVPVGVARSEQDKLPPKVPAGVDQRPLDQVHALLGHQAGHADHEGDRRVDVEPETTLDKLLADLLAFSKRPRVVVHGQARVRGRVPEVLVDSVQHSGELSGDVRPRERPPEPPGGAAAEGLGGVARRDRRDGVGVDEASLKVIFSRLREKRGERERRERERQREREKRREGERKGERQRESMSVSACFENTCEGWETKMAKVP